MLGRRNGNYRIFEAKVISFCGRLKYRHQRNAIYRRVTKISRDSKTNFIFYKQTWECCQVVVKIYQTNTLQDLYGFTHIKGASAI